MAKTKTFSVNTQKDPDTLVSEAKQVAKENDATFEGTPPREASRGKASKAITRYRARRWRSP